MLAGWRWRCPGGTAPSDGCSSVRPAAAPGSSSPCASPRSVIYIVSIHSLTSLVKLILPIRWNSDWGNALLCKQTKAFPSGGRAPGKMSSGHFSLRTGRQAIGGGTKRWMRSLTLRIRAFVRNAFPLFVIPSFGGKGPPFEKGCLLPPEAGITHRGSNLRRGTSSDLATLGHLPQRGRLLGTCLIFIIAPDPGVPGSYTYSAEPSLQGRDGRNDSSYISIKRPIERSFAALRMTTYRLLVIPSATKDLQ